MTPWTVQTQICQRGVFKVSAEGKESFFPSVALVGDISQRHSPGRNSPAASQECILMEG